MSDIRKAVFTLFIEELGIDIPSAQVSLDELADIQHDGMSVVADTLILVVDMPGSSALLATESC